MKTLYIIATPIGNMEDITLRALRVLKEVAIVASEDTRTTKRLFKHYSINTPLTSYFEHNKMVKTGVLLEKLENCDVALVSEAGMPGVSDPGYELVVEACRRGIRVIALPGASAFITALAVSGLPTDACHYLGFLPRKRCERKRLLLSVASEKVSIAAYEAPHRLISALHDILQVLGDRRISVCRELTKMYEEVFRGTVSEAISYFEQPRGEFTIIIEGCLESEECSVEDVAHRIACLKKKGTSVKEAMLIMSKETGKKRRDLYRAWLEN